MQVGDMNVVNSIVNLEVQVGFLSKVIEHMANNHGNAPAAFQVNIFRTQAQEEVKARYPNMGIQFNG